MRIDKFMTHTGKLSRTEANKACRAGRIQVNGAPVKKGDVHIDPEKDIVTLDGAPVVYRKYTYIMLNKPEGYVSATEDKNAPYVTELLSEELRRLELFPVGRLDKYTVGLMLLCDDGEGAHRLLSPKHHAKKVYRFECEKPLCRIEELEAGVHIEGGYLTKPCKVKKTGEFSGEITLTEGKYHQIKQMLYAVGNKITYLERISFGGIPLDPTLERGQYRLLTQEEIDILLKNK